MPWCVLAGTFAAVYARFLRGNLIDTLNEDYILKIAAIADDKPSVSCFTCHRGQPKPGAGPRPPRPSPVAP